MSTDIPTKLLEFEGGNLRLECLRNAIALDLSR